MVFCPVILNSVTRNLKIGSVEKKTLQWFSGNGDTYNVHSNKDINPWSAGGTLMDQKMALTASLPIFSGLKHKRFL